ncbi:substrate-binding periplasmic protein [Paraglaciecola aestuariivivens]
MANSSMIAFPQGIFSQMKALAAWLWVYTFFAFTPMSQAQPPPTPELYYDLGEDGGWVPYRNSAKTGGESVFSDLTKAIGELTEIKFTAVYMPQKRAEKALIDGIVDFDFVCLEWFTNRDPGKAFVVTQPMFEINEYLITLKHNTHLFPTSDAMYGKVVGTIAGYFYYDDNKFIRADFLNENLLLQGLKHDRFQVIILERETAKYWAKLNNTEIGFAAQHTSGNILMRLRKPNRALLPAIDAAITTIKQNGRLQQILDFHDVEAKIYPSLVTATKAKSGSVSKAH